MSDKLGINAVSGGGGGGGGGLQYMIFFLNTCTLQSLYNTTHGVHRNHVINAL